MPLNTTDSPETVTAVESLHAQLTSVLKKGTREEITAAQANELLLEIKRIRAELSKYQRCLNCGHVSLYHRP